MRGQEIEPMDIPVTEFQFNKKDDFKTAYDKANNQDAYLQLPAMLVGSVVFLAFSYGLFIESSIIAIISSTLLIVLIIAVGSLRNRRFIPQKKVELNRIRKSLRTDYEVMRDDQRENMMMGAALQLGTNVITRRVADRKEITFK